MALPRSLPTGGKREAKKVVRESTEEEILSLNVLKRASGPLHSCDGAFFLLPTCGSNLSKRLYRSTSTPLHSHCRDTYLPPTDLRNSNGRWGKRSKTSDPQQEVGSSWSPCCCPVHLPPTGAGQLSAALPPKSTAGSFFLLPHHSSLSPGEGNFPWQELGFRFLHLT